MKKVLLLSIMLLVCVTINAQSNDKVKRVKKAIERLDKKVVTDSGWLTGVKPDYRIANQKRRKANKKRKKELKLKKAIANQWRKEKRVKCY